MVRNDFTVTAAACAAVAGSRPVPKRHITWLSWSPYRVEARAIENVRQM